MLGQHGPAALDRGDEPIATGKVRVGVIGARSFVPTPLPDDLYETIKAFIAEEA